MITRESKLKSNIPLFIFQIVLKLMLVHNSVYIFLSGIFISLSTNLLTSLYFNPIDPNTDVLTLTIIFTSLASGAAFILVGTKLSSIQEKINLVLTVFAKDDKKDGDMLQINRRNDILLDFAKPEALKWSIEFGILILSTLIALILTIIKTILFR